MDLPKLVSVSDLEIFPEVKKLLESHFDVQYILPQSEVLAKSILQADAYYAGLGVQLTRQMIMQSERLKVISTPSTGLDHIDLNAAKEKGIAVLGLKDDLKLLEQITSTAELAWTLVLACSRKLISAQRSAQEGCWGRDKFRGHQLAYRTFGILGCGRLGTIVAQYAHAFRMRVIACDTREITLPFVQQVSFDQLLRESDILSIHIHLTPENVNFVNEQAFEKIKPGATLINTSRGAIVNEDALLDALKTGKIAAAGLDVIDGEWRNDLTNHPLISYMKDHENLLITPHIGGVTFESQKMAKLAAAHKLIEFFEKPL